MKSMQRLMPVVMDQTHANGKMSSVLGKLVSGRAKGLNRLVARQRNQTAGAAGDLGVCLALVLFRMWVGWLFP